MINHQHLILKKVRVHNLRSVDLDLPHGELIVFSGVSGSGKSSMAFDTLYVEGQRRYVESLSSYARKQMGDLVKPDLESAEGITPTISIEQKTTGRTPRSTVGTITEIYDYLRVLYARIGIPHCPISGEAVMPQSRERIIKTVQSTPSRTKLIILAPYALHKKGEFVEDFQDLLRRGFMRARVDKEIIELESPPSLDGSLAHDIEVVIDRLVVDEANQSRIAEAIQQALQFGNGICTVYDVASGEEKLFSMHAYAEKSGISYPSLEPYDFSFNTPQGMCERCEGLGRTQEFDLAKVVDPDKSISEDCCSVATSYETVRYKNIYDNLSSQFGLNLTKPWKKLTEKDKNLFLYGVGDRWITMTFIHPVTGVEWVDRVKWKGVVYEAKKRLAEAKSDRYQQKMTDLMIDQVCVDCQGERLRAYPRATQLSGKRLGQLCRMPISALMTFFEEMPLNPLERKIADDLLREVKQRLHFLIDVGLGYLALERTSPTLSGGEAQRVRLASQIGCGLVGITYILDEPSIGLHPRDNKKLISTLKSLRNQGNTVIVVEHDEETIRSADRVVDFGPGPGIRGGTILCNGTVRELLENEESVTGAYLSGRKSIPIPKRRPLKKKEALVIEGATHHNLKGKKISIPLGGFVCVAGVSGSGKSSLITDILYPALVNALHKGSLPVGTHKSISGIEKIDKVIAIDQAPIGRNPRSNPATYIKLLDPIRELFSMLPESRARGYTSGRFSFNVAEGACLTCSGMGMVKIDMDFMDDVWMECSVCQGRRFDEETLSIHYKGKTIYDVLEMEVSEALDFLGNIPAIRTKLETLVAVGLEYLKIGQSCTTLSGGESQRVKLAKELSRPNTGKTLYILDEPTTGLHFHDIHHLLDVLHTFVDQGNSVLVIEHNIDVIKTADWVLELGPEGGDGGGEIVAAGTPDQLSKWKTATGVALQEALNGYHPHHHHEQEIIASPIEFISVEGAEQHNLKRIDVKIPRGKMTVCTGPSGSGKSSLAFDTIYAEGQRRYIDSLSPYARQFVQQMPKPRVAKMEGLSPAIAIEQKAHAGNPRSTIGTMTEIYDLLRVLYARIGIPHCPETGEVIRAISREHVVERLLAMPMGTRLQILAPLEMKKNETFETLKTLLQRQGFVRLRLNGEIYDLDSDSIPYDRKRKNEVELVIDRVVIAADLRHRLSEALETAAKIGHNKIKVLSDKGSINNNLHDGTNAKAPEVKRSKSTQYYEYGVDFDRFNLGALALSDRAKYCLSTPKEEFFFNLSFAVESTGRSYPAITPHSFSFNSKEGMCPECEGLGVLWGANIAMREEFKEVTVLELMRQLWTALPKDPEEKMFLAMLKEEKIDPQSLLRQLKPPQLNWLMQGSPSNKTYPLSPGVDYRWAGFNRVLAWASRSSDEEVRAIIRATLDEVTCFSCQGTRLHPLARHVTIGDVSLPALCALPIEKSQTFLLGLKIPEQEKDVLAEALKQLHSRFTFLLDVGLGYLSLDRRAPTLSGGEAQRIRLARQLGGGLTGVLYVLDEPTIGLHPRDNKRLNDALKKLKNLGNTLLLVEHDPLTLNEADYLIDFGPGAGTQGGHIVAQGTLQQIKKDKNSLTGAYLSGRMTIPLPGKKRKGKKPGLKVKKATLHNLKNVSVEILLGAITCLTGVSGSGKSSLMRGIIAPCVKAGLFHQEKSYSLEEGTVEGIDLFQQMISIDQNPLGGTFRADVGSYTELLPKVRDFFAALPQARVKGLSPGHFSYNTKYGMCTECFGMGYKKIDLHFLPSIQVECPVCAGMRLNPVSLEVKYRGKNFGEYLKMTVDEAREVFSEQPRITRILNTLIDVGLGYLQLGQQIQTLSGGEAQRVKLSRELARRTHGSTLYLFDEPTTGLHFDDIAKLLKVLHRLADAGHTLLIIEHNEEVIRHADVVVELGPEAGERGGYVV